MVRGWFAGLILTVLLGFFPLAVLAQTGSSSSGATKENLDLPVEAGGESDEDEEAPEVVVFYSQQYEGDGFFFSCDLSGSMRGDKLHKLQREVMKNVTQFSDKVQFAICFFNSQVKKFPANGRPADASPAMKAAAMAFVTSATVGPQSCSRPSLIAALTFANQSSAKRKLIIHLSDGMNYCNGQDLATYNRETLDEVATKNTQHVKINTICIGSDNVDEVWMKTLAEQNGGKASRVQ
jgi:VWA domain-containing protein